jgi:hypothetical protein
MWHYNGSVWSIFGSTLYQGTTAKQTLSTATGICGATEFINVNDFGNKGLFIADGIDAWVIDSSDTVTRVDTRHLQWEANTIVEVGDRRVAVNVGSYWYVCTVAGRTGSTEPTWPTTVGNTVVDNEVTWRCEGSYTGPDEWKASTAYVVGDEVIPTTESGYWYECINAGTSAGAEPSSWSLILGDTVTDGGVIWECKGQYGGFPSPHVPSPTTLDGYIFLPEVDSVDIYGSDTTYPFSWGALNFAAAENFSDKVVGLTRQNNFVVAFGEKSTEFFYNYAKANKEDEFDTPLERYESILMQVGTLCKDSFVGSEKLLVFVGESDLGGRSVWRVDGTSAKEVSTEYIEKFIDLESSTSGVTSYGLRIIGHILFVLNLPTANKTFVYDLEENMWTEWQYDGGMFPFPTFCDADGILLLQHQSNGKIYKLSSQVYSDFDSEISCRITLAKLDFDTDKYKFFHKTAIIGDKSTGTDIIRWSDDDYTSWSNDYELTSGIRPYLMRSGKARRRAWELKYTDNSPRRLEALEVVYSIGDH